MPNLRDASGARRTLDLDLSAWIPDGARYANQGFPDCSNVYPANLGFYRPMPQIVREGANTLADLVPTLTNVSGQLFGIRGLDDNAPYYFVTAADAVGDLLYFFRYVENTGLWEDVTPISGPIALQFGSYGYYTTFGTDIYVGYGIAGQIMSKPIDTPDRFAIVTDAPRAADIASIRGFLVGVNVAELGQNNRNGVSWSAAGDPTNWIDPIADPNGALAVLRGFTSLPGGGRLQRIIPGIAGADAIIFGQRKIWRMTFIGPPSVWDFQVVEEAEGTSFPSSVVSL